VLCLYVHNYTADFHIFALTGAVYKCVVTAEPVRLSDMLLKLLMSVLLVSDGYCSVGGGWGFPASAAIRRTHVVTGESDGVG